MILASAQTSPIRGNIAENLIQHYRLINLAVENGANLIVFPELSITGYEREMAQSLAFTPNDARLNKLAQLAVDNKIIIIAGAPLTIDSNLFIGQFIFQPNNSVAIYTKQFLHPGEEVYYKSSFNHNPSIKLGNERISFAICADIDHPKHPHNASKVDASIYIASIFFSPNGLPSAHQSLSTYAKQYSMCVLMSNFCGQSYGQPSAGRSAFWNNTGTLIAEMDSSNSGLLLVEKNSDNWIGRIINDAT